MIPTFCVYRVFLLWFSSEKTQLFGVVVPAEAAIWNLLALAWVLYGAISMDIVNEILPKAIIIQRVLFVSTVIGAVVMMALAVLHL
jgi:uncharacterized membrane protein YuzA (DUF378 family)